MSQTNSSAVPDLSPVQQALMGGQMLFVAFGALVLVPLLTGLNANVAFFTAGVGTLIFQLVTGRMVPVFLASSFAFIAPITFGIAEWGLPATMGGMMAAGFLYVILSVVVKVRGSGILYRLFPPVVVGPVIMVIGLGLAPVAISMATGEANKSIDPDTSLVLASISLMATLGAAVFAGGIIKLIPILCGIVIGYITALFMGVVDFSSVAASPWLAVPDFTFPEFNANAILYMIPVAIAPAIEHIGDMLAISSVTGKDYLKKPGLHRTLLGDGLATSFASLLGGPPNTTYSEVTGAVMLTKSFNPAIMTWAAVTAVVVAFIGKVGGLLATIPTPVMGGIMVLLFGSIAVVGLNTLIKARVDLSIPRNLVIVALVLVFGLGNLSLDIFGLTLKGVSLCAITAVILNLVLPHAEGEDHYSSREVS
ncbi:uracil-xanthine permease family protein [Sansalvadorimonas sp. 2012CJ34-2]|uniref:Uracil-xanthine permease family protein n=1 Tax=Parendozoicomonas callyspongiae TaxID=2942213 RepID=A0ABT0PLI0_9GAMM|nr:uracil-xanthine permease family protein [Sansalvadorimonas sp. 2012CJ34-2]MCL6271303.1 uracil-xanthine permease family protein [Sansalvadorimonas sp. 2012CJ34-2]